MDSDKWDKTAHANSYIVDTSPECAEYLFQRLFFIFDQMLFKKLINLTLMDSDKWDKTALVKSYKVDISPKCKEYLSPF